LASHVLIWTERTGCSAYFSCRSPSRSDLGTSLGQSDGHQGTRVVGLLHQRIRRMQPWCDWTLNPRLNGFMQSSISPWYIWHFGI